MDQDLSSTRMRRLWLGPAGQVHGDLHLSGNKELANKALSQVRTDTGLLSNRSLAIWP
ncbi:MAG: hypothetical protein V3R33_10410 [Anaerolineales bacterium]